MTQPYLMESKEEGQRLLKQARANPARERMQAAGLRPGMSALDVGCGAGGTLLEMLDLVGPEGSVAGVDPSLERLEEARGQVQTRCALLPGALPNLDLPGGEFDFVWSQFVFEYLANPAAALRELIRVTRPGGRVAVAEVDALGLDFWPVPPLLEEGIRVFVPAVQRTGFDPWVGRKLFHLFRTAGLRDVGVDASMHYLVGGPASSQLLEDWRLRFQALEKYVAPAFPRPGGYAEFAEAYLKMLADPDTLKFIHVLTTSATRPADLRA